MARMADQPSTQPAALKDDDFVIIDAGYDIALVGKTGMGKSTLGNKLLHNDRSRSRLISPRSAIGLLDEGRDSESVTAPGVRAVAAGAAAASAMSDTASAPAVARFFTADDYPEQRHLSITKKCKLLANDETKVRVLDVPGFCDSSTLSRAAECSVSTSAGNLQTMRWIARVQAHGEINLRVRRMVYFLPCRGVPEKTVGTLEGELQLMYRFFGAAIFNCMVVVATSQAKIWKRKGGQEKFDEEDMKETERIFHIALKRAIEDDKIGCPPVVFIGINDKDADVLAKIKKAPVLKDEPLKLEFVNDICAQCGAKTRSIGKENLEVVIDGTSRPYEESKCHPCFVQKYTTGKKFAGGLAHVVTLGIVYVASRIRGRKVWPGFTTSDEICPACRLSPGSEGCTQVNESVDIEASGSPGRKVVVNHTNKL